MLVLRKHTSTVTIQLLTMMTIPASKVTAIAFLQTSHTSCVRSQHLSLNGSEGSMAERTCPSITGAFEVVVIAGFALVAQC